MNLCYLAAKLIWKQKLLSLLVLVQILCSALWFSAAVDKYDHILTTREAVNNLESDNVYILNTFSHENDYFFNSALYQVSAWAKLGTMYCAYNLDIVGFQMIGYSDELIQHYKMVPLSRHKIKYS